ncbi:hypothetical protein BB559_004926 [Furculomyces boomerangus]|uniref:Uncharacterized protein n=1 Tax=Furculomyces boomerangus TaxID=61424 RepID=A0A2T9YBY6_9FUNG|nr:hypothetical protein BB559_005871 [Furculomyces boomerangus]PVU89814.1 hypothetical protein BB559_004926 [Furculomyces boomerangus]
MIPSDLKNKKVNNPKFWLGIASFGTFVAARYYLDNNRKSIDIRKRTLKRRQMEYERIEKEKSSKELSEDKASE